MRFFIVIAGLGLSIFTGQLQSLGTVVETGQLMVDPTGNSVGMAKSAQTFGGNAAWDSRSYAGSQFYAPSSAGQSQSSYSSGQSSFNGNLFNPSTNVVSINPSAPPAIFQASFQPQYQQGQTYPFGQQVPQFSGVPQMGYSQGFATTPFYQPLPNSGMVTGSVFAGGMQAANYSSFMTTPVSFNGGMVPVSNFGANPWGQPNMLPQNNLSQNMLSSPVQASTQQTSQVPVVLSIDNIFPANAKNLTLSNPASAATTVFKLKFLGKDSIDYSQAIIQPHDFSSYSLFSDSLTAVLNSATNLGLLDQLKNPDRCCMFLEQEIGYLAWLRYWLNTKEVRPETVKPNPNLQGSDFLPVTEKGFANLGELSQKSTQQIIIDLVNNKSVSVAQGQRINVVETIFKTFVALFKKRNSGFSSEGKFLGFNEVREERRSLLSVLASMFFDMPDIYFSMCNNAVLVDIFDDVEDVLKLKSKNIKLTGRELILASQIYAPNKGTYLDINEISNQSNNQASLLKRYSGKKTPEQMALFLDKINEVRACLLSGKLKVGKNRRESNAILINSDLSSCVDLLNSILEAEGIATLALGERLQQVKTLQGSAIVKAEALDPILSEKLTFLRSECFLSLLWSLSHWLLVAAVSKINSKVFNFTTFSETQRTSFEMLAKFCSTKNFFLLNLFSTNKSKNLQIPPNLFLSKELDAIILLCLQGFQSAFQQDNVETRLSAMDSFKKMIQSSPDNASEPWPEPIPLVFQNSIKKFIEVTKSLMDHLDAGEILPTAVMNRSSNIDVLKKFLEIVEAFRRESWFGSVFGKKSALTVEKIEKKYEMVKNKIDKITQENNANITPLQANTVSGSVSNQLPVAAPSVNSVTIAVPQVVPTMF